MKRGSESTITIGSSKSALVDALHSLENVLGLTRISGVCAKIIIIINLLGYKYTKCLLSSGNIILKSWQTRKIQNFIKDVHVEKYIFCFRNITFELLNPKWLQVHIKI